MKSYIIAKLLKKMRLSSYKQCVLDSTAKVDSECTLSKVKLGRYSYVGAGTRLTDAVIGNFCSIGGRCGIGGGIHPINMVSTSPAFLEGRNILRQNFATIQYKTSSTVEIGNDVWIGEGVCILSGVKIGDGSIIGAHTVVTSDVEPYSIVVGVPGRAIKKRFDEHTIHDLLELQWWNWPDDKLRKYGAFFDSPANLINAID